MRPLVNPNDDLSEMQFEQIWASFVGIPAVRSWLFSRNTLTSTEAFACIKNKPEPWSFCFGEDRPVFKEVTNFGELPTVLYHVNSTALGVTFGLSNKQPLLPIAHAFTNDPEFADDTVIVRRSAVRRVSKYSNDLLRLQFDWFRSGVLGVDYAIIPGTTPQERSCVSFAVFGYHVYKKADAEKLYLASFSPDDCFLDGTTSLLSPRGGHLVLDGCDSNYQTPCMFCAHRDAVKCHCARQLRQRAVRAGLWQDQYQKMAAQQVVYGNANGNNTTDTNDTVVWNYFNHRIKTAMAHGTFLTNWRIVRPNSGIEGIIYTYTVPYSVLVASDSMHSPILQRVLTMLGMHTRSPNSIVTLPQVYCDNDQEWPVTRALDAICEPKDTVNTNFQLGQNFAASAIDPCLGAHTSATASPSETVIIDNKYDANRISAINSDGTEDEFIGETLNISHAISRNVQCPRAAPPAVIVQSRPVADPAVQGSSVVPQMTRAPGTTVPRTKIVTDIQELRQRPHLVGVRKQHKTLSPRHVNGLATQRLGNMMGSSEHFFTDALGINRIPNDDSPGTSTALDAGKNNTSVGLSSGTAAQQVCNDALSSMALTSDAMQRRDNVQTGIQRRPGGEKHAVGGTLVNESGSGSGTKAGSAVAKGNGAGKAGGNPGAKKKEARKWQCNQCDAIIRGKRSNLTRHISNKHTNFRAFVCPREDCRKPFQTRLNLVRHETQVHDGRPFSCGECKRAFKTQEQLIKHQAVAHGPGSTGLSCPYCGCCYGKRSTVSRHIASVHKDIVRRQQEVLQRQQQLSVANGRQENTGQIQGVDALSNMDACHGGNVVQQQQQTASM